MFQSLLTSALILPLALVAQDLPKAETIMDHFVEVTGGKAAYANKHCNTVKGTVEMAPMGLKGSTTIYSSEPNLFLIEMELGGLGKIKNGFDGKVAWAYSALQGPQIKSGEEKDSAEHSARFHKENWKGNYKQVQTIGTESVDAESCYKVLAIPHKGRPITMYYSMKSGLLLKMQTKVKTAMGEIPMDVAIKNYKSVGGVLVAHTMVQSFAGQTMTFTFTSVEWNTPIPASLFDPPAEVKALLNAPATTTTPTPTTAPSPTLKPVGTTS